MTNDREDAKTLTVRLEVEKETPGTIRYTEIVPIGDDPVMRTLYLVKWAAHALGGPERVKITIEADDENPYPRTMPKKK